MLRLTALFAYFKRPVHRAFVRAWHLLLWLGLGAGLTACGAFTGVQGGSSMMVVPVSQVAASSPAKAAAATGPAQDRECSDMIELPESPLAARASAPDLRGVAPVQLAAGQAMPAADALSIVYFDFDSAVIREEFTPILEAHARYLAADSSRHVVLEGHCDERGSREYNIALGQRRSESVRRALSLLGVKASQMETISFGEEKPAVDEQNETAYAKNRRVEFTYR